jgi:hypothetical protein
VILIGKECEVEMSLESLETLVSFSKYGDLDGDKLDLTENEIRTLEWAVGTIQIQEDKIKRYEAVLSNIANIDGGFIDGYGDDVYTAEEACQRIDEMVAPIWKEIVESNKKKEGVANDIKDQ